MQLMVRVQSGAIRCKYCTTASQVRVLFRPPKELLSAEKFFSM
jgi:hypothetical protein